MFKIFSETKNELLFSVNAPGLNNRQLALFEMEK